MLENIYICRHGFRSNWIDATIKTGPTKLERDPPLASYGLDQSESLSLFLSSPNSYTSYSPFNPPATSHNKNEEEGTSLPKPELVFSSPFYRCIQTAEPTAQRLGVGVRLEHGVSEWYSNVLPDTGLHPRPSHAPELQPLFPKTRLEVSWESTVYASKRGESLSELLARAELFADVFPRRVEAEFPNVKTVVIFAHAATVIALGRAFTGNKSLHVDAGCASTSLYRRRHQPTQTQTSTTTSTSELPVDSSKPIPKGLIPDGVVPENEGGPVAEGEYECVWHGRADYLVNGLERNWGFKDVVLNSDGHVIMDKGDERPHAATDELPLGLPPRNARYLSKPDPYTPVVMRSAPPEVQKLAGHDRMRQDKDDVERAVITNVEQGDGGSEGRPGVKRQGSGVALLESRM